MRAGSSHAAAKAGTTVGVSLLLFPRPIDESRRRQEMKKRLKYRRAGGCLPCCNLARDGGQVETSFHPCLCPFYVQVFISHPCLGLMCNGAGEVAQLPLVLGFSPFSVVFRQRKVHYGRSGLSFLQGKHRRYLPMNEVLTQQAYWFYFYLHVRCMSLPLDTTFYSGRRLPYRHTTQQLASFTSLRGSDVFQIFDMRPRFVLTDRMRECSDAGCQTPSACLKTTIWYAIYYNRRESRISACSVFTNNEQNESVLIARPLRSCTRQWYNDLLFAEIRNTLRKNKFISLT